MKNIKSWCCINEEDGNTYKGGKIPTKETLF